MKSVFVFGLSVIALSASAHAATAVLIDQEDSGLQVTGIEYRVNPAMGRAWALVETYDSSIAGGDDGDPAGESRVKVPGLSFDAAASQIVYAAEGGQVVCANVVSQPRKLLINPTGACGFHTARGSHVVDDGFTAHVEHTLDVYFDVK
jgi:hypothetical protein